MYTPSTSAEDRSCLPCADVPWSQAQWDRVRQVVAEEAQKSRVAAGFLPLYGPLSSDTDFVRRSLISTTATPLQSAFGAAPRPQRLEIDDTSTIRLWTLQVNLYLRGPQLADPELTSVLALFRRAANVLARLEDTVVFNGIPKLSDPSQPQPQTPLAALPPIWEILGRSASDDPTRQMQGLLPGSPQFSEGYDPPKEGDGVDQQSWRYRNWTGIVDSNNNRPDINDKSRLGSALVGTICRAIGELEANGYYGPFALVVGHALFEALQTPNTSSLVLPQDRVIPFLGAGGTLLRSTTLPADQGVIVALGGDPIELVIAKDITVDFLQITADPAYVFRLHEKMVLRMMNPGAIRGLRLDPSDSARGSTGPSSAPVKSST
jgi:uncharacterized linocin/CFP29 family protein